MTSICQQNSATIVHCALKLNTFLLWGGVLKSFWPDPGPLPLLPQFLCHWLWYLIRFRGVGWAKNSSASSHVLKYYFLYFFFLFQLFWIFICCLFVVFSFSFFFYPPTRLLCDILDISFCCSFKCTKPKSQSSAYTLQGSEIVGITQCVEELGAFFLQQNVLK